MTTAALDRVPDTPSGSPGPRVDGVRSIVALAALLFFVAVAAGGPVVATQHYAVTTTPRVDVPDRTVAFEGDSFQVADLGRVDPGESVTAAVDAASGEAYSVALYNGDGQELEAFDGLGTEAFTFETSSAAGPYEPGTYVVAVTDNGFQAVAPVVISGYHVDVDAPSSAERGATVTVGASVTTVDDAKPVDRVQVVVADDDTTRRETLSADGNGDYGGSVSLDGLAEGAYALYVVVQGDRQVLDSAEVLGVSDSQSLQVEPEATETTDEPTAETTDEPTTSADGGAGGASSDGSAGGSSSDVSSGGSSGDGSSDDDSTTAEPTDTPTATTTAVPPTSTTEASVITPNAAVPPTVSSGQPLGVVPVLLALLIVAVLARRRRWP